MFLRNRHPQVLRALGEDGSLQASISFRGNKLLRTSPCLAKQRDRLQWSAGVLRGGSAMVVLWAEPDGGRHEVLPRGIGVGMSEYRTDRGR